MSEISSKIFYGVRNKDFVNVRQIPSDSEDSALSDNDDPEKTLRSTTNDTLSSDDYSSENEIPLAVYSRQLDKRNKPKWTEQNSVTNNDAVTFLGDEMLPEHVLGLMPC